MSESPDELRRLAAEADALEADLLRRGARTMPADRYAALHALMRAEMAMLLYREEKVLIAALDAAGSVAEQQTAVAAFRAAVETGMAALRDRLEQQAQSWTLLGLAKMHLEVGSMLRGSDDAAEEDGRER